MTTNWFRFNRPGLGIVAVFALMAFLPVTPQGLRAQGRGGPPQTPKAAAPIDLTGYWVALITEDWRYRMMVPAKGDFPNVPVTAEGRKVAEAWDPDKDTADGNQCRAFGAGGITRMTGRLHITWQDDNTLKVDADTGTQTRIFRFAGAAAAGEPTWQGDNFARWELSGPGGRGAGEGGRGGSLKVVTTHFKSGYLQRNGVPYSANAMISEYYDVVKEADGTQYLIVTTLVEDPTYLARRFLRSTHFKKQTDAAGWDPTPCEAK
jgi:hypothetical protein